VPQATRACDIDAAARTLKPSNALKRGTQKRPPPMPTLFASPDTCEERVIKELFEKKNWRGRWRQVNKNKIMCRLKGLHWMGNACYSLQMQCICQQHPSNRRRKALCRLD
jgi:hypothetical protein